MKRALLIVLDSVGIGAAPDAGDYGDEGTDTLGHILDRCPDLRLPALWSLGLGRALGRGPDTPVRGSYGRLTPRAAGKDSTTGHWELAGVILDDPFAVFDRFPDDLVKALEAATGAEYIGNYAASGTQIIQDLGEEHVRTGRPILYTSADSVLQIAAHEEVVPLERLYDICRLARPLADEWRIGRVIARPFVGGAGNFVRTGGRHDFSMLPPPTVLNAIRDAGLPVVSIGKVNDLFAGEGITASHPTKTNAEGMRAIEQVWAATEGGLVFTNLVDFDMLFGHRRDVESYAGALADFDAWLAGFLRGWNDDDLLMITADHGNDPTFRGSDHTREYVPLLVRNGGYSRDLGTRPTFADTAATLADYFSLPDGWPIGRSVLAGEGVTA